MQSSVSSQGVYKTLAQEVQERELPGVASRLEAAVQDLEDTVIELRGRLEPVRAQGPQSGPNEAAAPPYAVSSPFGGRLVDQIARIRGITNSAKSLIGELAV